MSSPTKNIINTLIDSKNMKNIPDNVSNDLVDELVQQTIIYEDNYDDHQHKNPRLESGNPNVMNANQHSNYYENIESNEAEEDSLVLNYSTNNILYSIAFQNSQKCRLALGTLEKSLNNKIEIVDMIDDDLVLATTEEHEFPSTKLMWSPSQNNNNLLAASSDVVRLYKYNEEEQKLALNLTLHNKKSKYCAPLTSFDWNKENNSILGTASIDTTCTIWDLNKNTIRTQLIAHDKEVFDIAFSQDEHIFISTGADGSIRLFDLRTLDHSTIIYETKDQTPITKIAWNLENSNFISALAWEKDTVYIIDSRIAMVSLVELKSHSAPVTSMAWAPQSNSHICSVGEDKLVLIWNIQSHLDSTNNGPFLSYKAPHEIYNVSWCKNHPEWIGITFKNRVQLLKV
jgi:WD repeat-containing protein 68